MADNDSVGKIGLDLEIQGDDIGKQIEQMASAIGSKISKSLEGITTKLDFSYISESLNRSLKKIDESINTSIEKNKESILKTIEEIKARALDCIKSIMSKAKGIKIPINFDPVKNISMPSQTVNKESSPRGPPKSVNISSLKEQQEILAQKLDITNQKIEQQKVKLERLKNQSGSLNGIEQLEARLRQIDNILASAGNKQVYNAKIIEEQIELQMKLNELKSKSSGKNSQKNIEAEILKERTALNKLEEQAHKTREKISRLDAEFERLSNAAKRSTSSVNSANNSINRVGNSAKNASNKLKSANNSTRQYRENINGARSATGMFIDSMFKWGIVFPVIMQGITAVSSYIGSALMTNAQFANSLNQIRSNLIVAFMPIYQAVLPALNALMSALANVTAYIAAFINALFGKTYQASFSAAKSMNASIASMKSMEKQGNKASSAVDKIGESADKTKKKIKGALAGFDEINKLSIPEDKDKKPKKSGSGVDPIPMVAPSVDLGPTSAAMKKINDMVARLKDLISKIFQPFKAAWAREGEATIASIKYALSGIWSLIRSIGKSFLDVWTNGTGERMLVIILQILQNIFNIIGDIATTFAKAWNSGNIGTKIIQGIANTINNLLLLVKKVGDSFREVWGQVGPSVADTFMQVLNSVIGVLENLSQKLVWVWDNGGSHLFQGFIRLGAKVFELAGYITTNFINPLVNGFVNLVAPAIAKITDILGSVLDAFSNLINWLLGSGKPVLDSMTITVTAFFAAWKIAKLMSFIQQAGGAVSVIKKIGTALKACTLSKIADNIETMRLTLSYAGEFIASLAGSTFELIKQAGQFAINTGLKIADTTAQIAMTAATVAWNVVCGIATVATTTLGAAIAFLTSPIGIVIIAITAIIGVGVLLYKHWDELKAKAIEVWNRIKEKFNQFKEWLSGIFERDWSKSFGVLGNLLNAFLRNVKNIFGGVKQIFGGIIDFVAGVFTGNWERAWKGVVNIFKGIFNMLSGIAKAPLNAVIGLINMAIDGLNTISFTIPDWSPIMPGKHFGVNLPKINYLAKGGVVDKATPAVVGEAGTEAVVPLENNTKGLDLLANKLTERIDSLLLKTSNILTQPNLTMLGQNDNTQNTTNNSKYFEELKKAIIEALKESRDNKGITYNSKSDNVSGDIVLKLNDRELGRATIEAINKVNRQAGEQLLKI
ncbi:hypothetical protein QJR26_02250 [Clostridium baratii]